jgi:hypothetical protein
MDNFKVTAYLDLQVGSMQLIMCQTEGTSESSPQYCEVITRRSNDDGSITYTFKPPHNKEE